MTNEDKLNNLINEVRRLALDHCVWGERLAHIADKLEEAALADPEVQRSTCAAITMYQRCLRQARFDQLPSKEDELLSRLNDFFYE